MPAHQCPRCPLRFSFRTEVEAHLATDHRPKETVVAAATAQATADREAVAANARAPS